MTTHHRGTAAARPLDHRRANRTGREPSPALALRRRRTSEPPVDVAAEITPSCVSALLATGVRSLLADRGVEASRPSDRTALAGGSLLSANEVAELVARLEIALERGYGIDLSLGTPVAGHEPFCTIGSLARHVATTVSRTYGRPAPTRRLAAQAV